MRAALDVTSLHLEPEEDDAADDDDDGGPEHAVQHVLLGVHLLEDDVLEVVGAVVAVELLLAAGSPRVLVLFHGLPVLRLTLPTHRE